MDQPPDDPALRQKYWPLGYREHAAIFRRYYPRDGLRETAATTVPAICAQFHCDHRPVRAALKFLDVLSELGDGFPRDERGWRATVQGRAMYGLNWERVRILHADLRRWAAAEGRAVPGLPVPAQTSPDVDQPAGASHELALIRAAGRLAGLWGLVQPPHLVILALQQKEASEGRLVPPDPQRPWDAEPALGWLRQHTGSTHALWQGWDRFAAAQAAYHRSALDALQQMRADMATTGLPFTRGFDGPSLRAQPGCGLGFFVDVVRWLEDTHRGGAPARQPLLTQDGILEGRHVATAPLAPKVVAAVNVLVSSWLTAPSTVALLSAWGATEARRADLSEAVHALQVADLRHGVCPACSGPSGG